VRLLLRADPRSEQAQHRAAAAVGIGETEEEVPTAGLARGEAPFSYALSEAGAGSDAAFMRTRAVRDGEHWLLNGTKM
jgi:alkylation response protein AidB-like acyl-CoA dehydrogenase